MRRTLRLGCASLAAAGSALLAWLMVAEIVEPHWTLGPAAMVFPRPQPLELPAIEGTMLRLYTDTRPHVGKISGLQKGLVWVAQGREMVEEGYGFGCPIIVIEGKSYNSRHAETEIVSTGPESLVVKRYTIDTLDTPIRLLQRKYRPVPSQGVVSVTYSLKPDGILDIEADFRGLKKAWERAYLMNEQGANHFRYYRDEEGKRYTPAEVGIWELGNTEQGCFESKDGRYAFCLEPGSADAIYFGRERYFQYNWRGIYYLSWAGVDVVVDGPRDSLGYRVVLLAR
jgi:hypothetical protein